MLFIEYKEYKEDAIIVNAGDDCFKSLLLIEPNVISRVDNCAVYQIMPVSFWDDLIKTYPIKILEENFEYYASYFKIRERKIFNDLLLNDFGKNFEKPAYLQAETLTPSCYL